MQKKFDKHEKVYCRVRNNSFLVATVHVRHRDGTFTLLSRMTVDELGDPIYISDYDTEYPRIDQSLITRFSDGLPRIPK